MSKLRFLIVIIICTALVGCRSGKDTVGGNQSLLNNSATTLTQRAEALIAASGEWTELNVPLKVEIKSPFSISGSGRAYMHRGQDIYISIRVLGFEVAVVYIDNNTVNIADKFNRRYLSEPIGDILGTASITISDIQDILLGRVFVNGKGTFDDSMLSEVNLAETSDSQWIITPKNKVAGATYSFSIDSSTNALKSLVVSVGKHTVSCDYSNAATTQCGTFMTDARVKAAADGKNIDALLRWTFSSAKFEVSESVKWKTPSGYQRISAADILKGINF